MTRGKWSIGAFVAAVALAAAPAYAQRSASSGTSTGEGAVSRGGGDSGGSSGGSSSSGSSTAGSSGGSSSSDSSGGGSWSAPSNNAGSSRSEYYSAPTHPSERQQTRQRGDGDSRRGGSDTGARAVPRGESGSAPGTTTRGTSAGAGADDAPARRAVPGTRSRDGRAATGTAVEREFPRVRPGGGIYDYPYYGYYGSSFYYSPYRRTYYVPAYGFGLGYFYDPYWYDPYAGGYGGYGGYGGGYYGGSGSGSYTRGETGSLRLKIEPRDAQVFVDGYFVGDVDNFDGLFQRLKIDAGGHRIEIRADGYDPIEFDVMLVPGETVTYKGELKRR